MRWSHDGWLYGFCRPESLWFVVGTLLIVAVLGGLYVILRDDLVTAETHQSSQSTTTAPDANTDKTAPHQSRVTSDSVDQADSNGRQPELLAVLPEDERRILTPVIESPGLTQIELRDRSESSKSKVSQTVTDLEQRGLLYRERQGRTFRIYPSDDLLERVE